MEQSAGSTCAVGLWKILNRPKEMNAVCKKVLLQCFPPVCPFCPVYFHLVMPQHLLSRCYALCEHTKGYKGVRNILLGMLCELTSAKHSVLYEVMSAKHAWVSLEKIGRGQKCRLEEKSMAAILLY
jgi:hypothetical protein